MIYILERTHRIGWEKTSSVTDCIYEGLIEIELGSAVRYPGSDVLGDGSPGLLNAYGRKAIYMGTSSFDLIEKHVKQGIAQGRTVGQIVDSCADAVLPDLRTVGFTLGQILQEFRLQLHVAQYPDLNYVIPSSPNYWRDHQALRQTLRTGLLGLVFVNNHPRVTHRELWRMSSECGSDGNSGTTEPSN